MAYYTLSLIFLLIILPLSFDFHFSSVWLNDLSLILFSNRSSLSVAFLSVLLLIARWVSSSRHGSEWSYFRLSKSFKLIALLGIILLNITYDSIIFTLFNSFQNYQLNSSVFALSLVLSTTLPIALLVGSKYAYQLLQSVAVQLAFLLSLGVSLILFNMNDLWIGFMFLMVASLVPLFMKRAMIPQALTLFALAFVITVKLVYLFSSSVIVSWLPTVLGVTAVLLTLWDVYRRNIIPSWLVILAILALFIDYFAPPNLSSNLATPSYDLPFLAVLYIFGISWFVNTRLNRVLFVALADEIFFLAYAYIFTFVNIGLANLVGIPLLLAGLGYFSVKVIGPVRVNTKPMRGARRQKTKDSRNEQKGGRQGSPINVEGFLTGKSKISRYDLAVFDGKIVFIEDIYEQDGKRVYKVRLI